MKANNLNLISLLYTTNNLSIVLLVERGNIKYLSSHSSCAHAINKM